MAQQTMTGRAAVAGASAGVAPEAGIRIAGVLLALAVAAAHVADKGGVTAFTSPDWIGWGYRLIEVGGVLTALAMSALARRARAALAAVGGRRARGRPHAARAAAHYGHPYGHGP